ncbi:Protein of unknown function (DUF1625) [Seminavis robusta]|uniref:Uncharacterized protein n=1 Tax=Seminavis robusta TaxID=568900 RepID=A0A9N8HV74_9STRA|nr:Protein of unknown function (DUF1625) [Seminavis robusta]|eukprot:Sro1472_g275520.1 Protein of unknown function (DUF1625) (494) ;mRNA; r:20368-21849
MEETEAGVGGGLTRAMSRTFGFGDPNVHIEHISYRQKLKNSCGAMGMGFLLFFGALSLSAWNEYRNVATMKAINEARDIVTTAACSPINVALEGKLVHVTCPVSNFQVLGNNDPVLQGVSIEQRAGLSLESYMEVYQWTETERTRTRKTSSGSTTRTTYYDHHQSWSTQRPKNASRFKGDCGDCTNYDPYDESWWSGSGYELGTETVDQSRGVKAGDYTIPDSKIPGLGIASVLTPACRDSTISCAPGNATLKINKMVWEKDGQDWMARSYTIYQADTVSILAQQRGDTFVLWEPSYDEDYGFLDVWEGSLTAEDMLNQKEAERVATTWILRFLSLVLCIVGLVMVTAPLTTVPDIIPVVGPWIGDLIGYALWAVSSLIGCCCWSFVVAVSWLVYRPVIGGCLLAASFVLLAAGGYTAHHIHKKKKKEGKDASVTGSADDLEVAEEYNPQVPGMDEEIAAAKDQKEDIAEAEEYVMPDDPEAGISKQDEARRM